LIIIMFNDLKIKFLKVIMHIFAPKFVLRNMTLLLQVFVNSLVSVLCVVLSEQQIELISFLR